VTHRPDPAVPPRPAPPPGRGGAVGRGLALLALALSPFPGFAGVKLTESATGEYVYNTNIFDLQSGLAVPGFPTSHRGDSFYSYGAGLGVDDLLSRADLFLNIMGKELRYDYFTQLNHTEYNLDGGLKWKLGTDVDGKLEVLRTRSMVQFYDLTPAAQVQLQLPIVTEQRETATVGFGVTPDWRVEGNTYHRVVDEPLDATPHLQLTETEGLMALKYIGLAGLTSGVTVAYISGRYAGGSAIDNPSYDQRTIDLVADYQLTGRSDVSGEVGYSRRSSAVATNSLSGVTGKIDYKGQLTGKSSVDVVLSRGINSYIANAGAEIDSAASVSLTYQVTYKIGISALYTYTDRNYPGQGVLPDTSRTDRQHDASLKMDYEIRRWLSIKPYVTYEKRESAFVGASFNATIYGISVIFHSID
jgi:hypothetical protein